MPLTVGIFSSRENEIILILAISAASISLVISMVALRWFLLMRRSFRHILILMLVCSNSFKALLHLISPIVNLSRGGIESGSVFCEISGFMLAVGIEAADISVFFIALHTTLYVFRPPRDLGKGGLFEHRRWVYGIWVVFPLLMASLAFINSGESAYVNLGTISYLPRRPFWYRLALAWIPRYIIFVSILAMYAAICINVRVKFHDVEKLGGDRLSSTTMPARQTLVMDRINTASEQKPARPFNSAVGSWSFAGGDKTGLDVIVEAPGPRYGHNQELLSVSWARNLIHGSTGRSEQERADLNGGQRHDLLAPIPFADSIDPMTATSSHLNNDQSRCKTSQQSIDTRRAIRRQLRFLFIYPLIYLAVWTLPFVQHCLSYTDYHVANPIFGLNLTTTCILALQAGIDCAIFSWRERPWRRTGHSSDLRLGWWKQIRHCDKPPKEENDAGKQSEMENQRQEKKEVGPFGRLDPESLAEPNAREQYWWEAEGRQRNDSVWMGTDQTGT